jgi:thiol:disulfide interchange protein DsbD
MYPLIPITVSYIGAQGKVSKATGFFLSLLYVLGTSVTYTVLGSVAGITGSLFGGLQTNPWVNLIVANVFILMGLAMLDVFFLPLRIILRSDLFSPKRKGFAGALLLGVASGLIMSPCSAPVLAVLLSYVATKQNIFFGMVLLFIFCLRHGHPAHHTRHLHGAADEHPRSGPWMVRIQKLFGFIFIAMGEYFSHNRREVHDLKEIPFHEKNRLALPWPPPLSSSSSCSRVSTMPRAATSIY